MEFILFIRKINENITENSFEATQRNKKEVRKAFIVFPSGHRLFYLWKRILKPRMLPSNFSQDDALSPVWSAVNSTKQIEEPARVPNEAGQLARWSGGARCTSEFSISGLQFPMLAKTKGASH